MLLCQILCTWRNNRGTSTYHLCDNNLEADRPQGFTHVAFDNGTVLYKGITIVLLTPLNMAGSTSMTSGKKSSIILRHTPEPFQPTGLLLDVGLPVYLFHPQICVFVCMVLYPDHGGAELFFSA